MRFSFRTEHKIEPHTYHWVYVDGHKFNIYSFSHFLDEVGSEGRSDIVVSDNSFGRLMLQLKILKSLGNSRWFMGATKGPVFAEVKKAIDNKIHNLDKQEQKEKEKKCKKHVWKRGWDTKNGKKFWTDVDYCIKCRAERKHVLCTKHRWRKKKIEKKNFWPNHDVTITNYECRCGETKYKGVNHTNGKEWWGI